MSLRAPILPVYHAGRRIASETPRCRVGIARDGQPVSCNPRESTQLRARPGPTFAVERQENRPIAGIHLTGNLLACIMETQLNKGLEEAEKRGAPKLRQDRKLQ